MCFIILLADYKRICIFFNEYKFSETNLSTARARTNTGYFGDPVHEIGNTAETSRKSKLASGRGAKTDDTSLALAGIRGSSNGFTGQSQGTTRVALKDETKCIFS